MDELGYVVGRRSSLASVLRVVRSRSQRSHRGRSTRLVYLFFCRISSLERHGRRSVLPISSHREQTVCRARHQKRLVGPVTLYIHTYYHGHRCTHIAWDFVVFILHGCLRSLFALSTLLSSHSHHIVTPIINVIRTTHRGNHIVKQLYHLCSCQVHKGTTTTQSPREEPASTATTTASHKQD